MSYTLETTRNFSIIAHIDHGKSTLADRLLEETQTISKRELKEQILDDMELEQERGITIKAHPVTMSYEADDGQLYQMNFIDTPGHVDFTYEVSRSLSACEGALLVVDAAQGVQAQTLANVYLAIDRGLEIIPVINKIDLPAADVEKVRAEIENVIGIDASDAIVCSAKTGVGIQELLEAIVHRIPAPQKEEEASLKGLVFDSFYDTYRGVMVYVRLFSGRIEKGMSIKLMQTESIFEVTSTGIFAPDEKDVAYLEEGQVGYFTANIKKTSDICIGDTVTTAKHPASKPLGGFKKIKPVVFAGIYPLDSNDYETLKDALSKLQLNDSALFVEQDKSTALGLGFRCGFLGLLHLEIVFERLRREYYLDIITTAPSVSYKILMKSGVTQELDSPVHYPDPSTIETVEEPWVKCNVMIPGDYLGALMNLAQDKRGNCLHTESIQDRLLLVYEFPLNEIVTDFNDRLKSVTKGYGSFDYEPIGYRPSDIIKLDIRVNEEPVDAFSTLVHRSKGLFKGRELCKRLLEVIPRQLFAVAIQAAIGGKIVARETIRPMRKNVTAKCYGGDITRKRKLLEKQKAGKKRMKQIGKVSIPQEAFVKVLKSSDV